MERIQATNGPAKMHTIAEHLDLSIATVSRALRRVPGINPATRSRVLAAAAEFGYKLPGGYRAPDLEQQTLRHIGVLIQTPLSHAPSNLYLVGMSEAAMDLNASLVVHDVNPQGIEKLLDPRFQPRAMQSGLLSGVVFVFRWPIEVVREISQRFRSVSIMHHYQGVDMDMVGVDNQEGVDLLMGHLHGLGHRKIGFLGRCADLHWATQRFGGYVASMAKLGMEYQPKWVIDMDSGALTNPQSTPERFLAEAERLTRERGVTAWICSTQTAGRQLYRWLTSHGLRVPGDVSVTGFHRSGGPDPGEISLTSVGASYQAMGAAALKRLLYRIQNPEESTRHILFPFELYKGRTTAEPPGDSGAGGRV